MYGLRRLQIGRCGELAERLSSRPTVARVVTREHRCGRGTLRQRNRKATPAGAARAARRSGSEFAKRMSSGDARRRHRRSPRTRTPPNGSTSESASADRCGRGTLRHQSRKVTPAGAARAARQSGSEFAKRMSSGDARRRHRRSRLAPERGCHEVTGVKKARLRSKRRGSGICPVFKRICPV